MKPAAKEIGPQSCEDLPSCNPNTDGYVDRPRQWYAGFFFFFFSFASWHELNKWASGQFLSPLLSRRLNFWIFAAPMINRFQYDVGASISQTWVCVQRSGQRYCTADRKQPVVLRERETFGYPQVADGAGCGGNLCGPRKILDRFV